MNKKVQADLKILHTYRQGILIRIIIDNLGKILKINIIAITCFFHDHKLLIQ